MSPSGRSEEGGFGKEVLVKKMKDTSRTTSVSIPKEASTKPKQKVKKRTLTQHYSITKTRGDIEAYTWAGRNQKSGKKSSFFSMVTARLGSRSIWTRFSGSEAKQICEIKARKKKGDKRGRARRKAARHLIPGRGHPDW